MDDGCANVLLLGETGAGKSTFVNALANYLEFASLEEAENGDVVCVVPAKFSITSEDGDLIEVHFNKDSNEDSRIGSSSTHDARAYVFAYRDASVRIIDTPGMNDSRGAIAKDADNLEDILRCIQKYKQLHAVCFLLKPDVTVLTAAFKYSLLEVLSRLDRSVAANIVFAFTRTRSTDYLAPDTLGCLRKLLSDVALDERVHVPLRFQEADGRNCFFFDNEGFKYLAAREKGLRMGSVKRLKESWEVSQKESRKLLDYILGTGDRPVLQPHTVQDTVAVNFARRLISSASRRLEGITPIVQDNINEIHEHQRRLDDEIAAVAELQEKSMALPSAYFDFLIRPVTVCTSARCTESYTIVDLHGSWMTRKRYKQICEDNSLRNGRVLNSLLIPAVFHFRGGCRTCECMNAEHITIEADALDQERALEGTAAILADLRKQSECLTQKQTIVAAALVKLACFLRKNSICPINTAYEEYLDCLIQTENRAQPEKAGKERLECYRTMKKEHVENKKLFEQAEKLVKEEDVKLATYADLVAISDELETFDEDGEIRLI